MKKDFLSELAKITDPAMRNNAIIDELMRDSRSDEDKKLDEMAASLFSMRFSDEGGIDNYYLDKFFRAYISETFPIFEQLFRTLWEKQIDTKQEYGDIDYSFQKLFEGEYSWKVKYGKEIDDLQRYVRVLYLDNHVSCAPHTKFIIIQENLDSENQDGATYHIRIVYDKSDYRKGNQYVQCPNLKWYKDRKYCLDFIDELHHTPLGGSYADGRDKGYVLTAKTAFFSKKHTVEHGSLATFDMYKFVTFYLDASVRELTEQDEIEEEE